MIHKKRVWTLRSCASPAEVAETIGRCASWCVCSGFRVPLEGGRAMLVLSDAFSEDGAQEYGVLVLDAPTTSRLDMDLASGWRAVVEAPQVESLTASWMDKDELAESLAALAAGANVPIEPRTGPVVTATSSSGLREALGSVPADVLCMARVTIETSQAHRGRACCA